VYAVPHRGCCGAFMRCSMQDIFGEHFAAYAQQRTLHPREQRAASCISQCYTAALGSTVLACPQGHERIVQYHACRHRSCPRCAERTQREWAQARLEQLLPCAHFHLVFTLPHAFIALWAFNRARMNQWLFDCARQSILELAAVPRHLGAMPGLLMALHTWGRTLSQHPHVHCLASAGGVDPQGQWRDSRKNFLVPLKPLQLLFRGKFLAHLTRALNAKLLRLPPEQDELHWRRTIARHYRLHWNIQICEPYPHGRGVALYLARYVCGGPLPRSRPLDLTGNTVSFGYTDHRDGRRKTLRLDAHEFISRVLWHAPPRSQHTVRHAGLYASAHRGQHRACRDHLATPTPPQPIQPLACHAFAPPSPPALRCSVCHAELVPAVVPTEPHQFGEFPPHPPPNCVAAMPNWSFNRTPKRLRRLCAV
jgi:Putative transposase/Transposase zinc-binding domain